MGFMTIGFATAAINLDKVARTKDFTNEHGAAMVSWWSANRERLGDEL
jgi:hypothetical protein